MSILIDVAAEFTGKKAFKQAESATDKLTKSAKTLGKTLGISLGTAAVLGFAKASVKAAAADQKAQQQLALALKNVGLGRDAATAEGYIQRLQSEFGIVDDKLRPAYQILAIATRDTAESQRLMGIAMDVSAASGVDLQAVSKALSKAYLGNNTALSKLGVGISKADLKTKSFKEITDQLSVTFAGAATTAASGYQGSLDKLTVASNNFKESIGTGLIEALQILSGDSGLATATTAFEKLGTKISDASIGLAYFLKDVKAIPGASAVLSLLSDPLGINTLLTELEKYKQQPRPFKTPMTISGQVEKKTSTTTQNKVAKETLKVNKDSLKLAKAKSIFDLQKIQIEAALKGKISEEERIRLKLMQAIESENIDQIDKYTKMLDEAQKNTEKLVSTLQSIKPLDDIFKNWSFMGVKEQLATLSSYFNNFVGSAASAFASLGAAQQAALGGYVPFKGATNASLGITSTGGNTTSMPSTVGLGTTGTGNQLPAGVTINTTIQGSVIAENDLNQAINDALAASGWAGSAIGYSRQAVITAV